MHLQNEIEFFDCQSRVFHTWFWNCRKDQFNLEKKKILQEGGKTIRFTVIINQPNGYNEFRSSIWKENVYIDSFFFLVLF
jgi:hypothetical protein